MLVVTLLQNIVDTYYVNILVVTLLHNTITVYYVDILVITLLYNTVGTVLCRYLGHYFAAQYCRQRTIWISLSLLCCIILQAVYYVDMLVVTLLYNIVGIVLCRYLSDYFAAQYCRQRTMYIPWSLLCCTILQAAFYVCTIFVITLLHNIVDRVPCRYLSDYFAAQYCRLRTMQISWTAAYYVDNLVITLLQYIVGSVLCRYLGQYFASQYCKKRTMQISWSLLYCTILQAAYYVDTLVITLLHNIVDSVLCRYLGHYFPAQYCRQRTMQIIWSLLCCTILYSA